MLFLALFQMLFFTQEVKVDASLEVEFVILDVVARDQEGKLVTDLTQDDFIVKENNKKIGLSLFDRLDFRTPEEGAEPPKEGEDPVMQTMILVLDLASADKPTVEHAFDQLEAFLGTLNPLNKVQMFLFSLDKGLISRGFTDTPDHLLDELVVFRSDFMKDYPSLHLKARSLNLNHLDKEMRGCLANKRAELSSQVSQKGSGEIGICLENVHQSFLSAHERHTKHTLNVLSKFVQFMARLEGPKSIYLVSPGFSVHAGEASASLLQAYRHSKNTVGGSTRHADAKTSTLFNSFPSEDNDFTNLFERMPANINFDIRDLEREFDSISLAALNHRISFHTFSIGSVGPNAQQLMMNSKAANINAAYQTLELEKLGGLLKLSNETGGVHKKGSKLNESLKWTLENHRMLYVLGYPLPKSKKGKYRNIEVICKRPGVKIDHRQGYWPNKKK